VTAQANARAGEVGELTREQFCERFVARLLELAGPTDGEGEPVEPYALETAPSYYEDDFGLSPEECAESDYSYWESGE